jgi:hypothetical protein
MTAADAGGTWVQATAARSYYFDGPVYWAWNDLSGEPDVRTEQLTIDGLGAATVALERMDDTQDLDVVPASEQTHSLDNVSAAPVDRPDVITRPGRRWQLRWPLISAGTVAAFALAMVVITGIEAMTGNSFSGERGSTVGQLAPNTSSAQRPADAERVDQGPSTQEQGDQHRRAAQRDQRAPEVTCHIHRLAEPRYRS